MTAIAAIADGTDVWMAADTGEPVGGTWHGAARKIRRADLPHGAGTVLLAVTGAGGLMAAAQHALRHVPADVDLIPDGDLDDWADRLARYLTRTAAEATPALTEPDRGGMTTISGSWLLGYHGRLWHVLAHHALPIRDGITAIGAGADIALGYMLGAGAGYVLGARAGEDARLFPSDLVRCAIECAAARIPYCGIGPDGPLVEHLGTPS